MNKSNIIITVLLLVILMCVGLLTYYFYITPNDRVHSDASKSLSVTKEKPFTDLQGNPTDFKKQEGKIRVVNIWASWDPFSAQELRDLNTVAQEYRDKGVVFIAINRKEPKEQAQRFLNSLPSLSNLSFVIDENDSFYNSIGGYAMPETVFYDTRGTITSHTRGLLTIDEMKVQIDSALQTQK